jgi:hypothetical protein
MPKSLWSLNTVLMVVSCLSLPVVSHAQDTPLIHACVDAQGRLRLVAPATACTAKETRATWPAEPGAVAASRYYYREQIFTASGGVPTGQILLCDDAADTAIAGGYAWDPPYPGFTDTSILSSYSCRQSGGRCAGGAGQDGWWLVAYSPSQSRNLTMWLTCAAAAPAP